MASDNTIELLNQSVLEAYRVHTDMACLLRMRSPSGGNNYKLTVSAASTEAPSITAVLASPTIGTVNTAHVNGTTIEGIDIPTDTDVVDFGFLIKQRDMIQGDHSNIVYTLTPMDVDDETNTPITFTIPLARNYDALGGMDKEKLLIGSGNFLLDYKDMGFFSDDGVEIAITNEVKRVKPGNIPGNVAAANILTKCIIKTTLMQFTLQNLLRVLNLRGTVMRSSAITAFGGTRAGEYIDIAPTIGWLPTFSCQFQGHSPSYAGKDIGYEFTSASVVNANALVFKAGTETLIPVEIEAWIDANAVRPNFGKIHFLDAE